MKINLSKAVFIKENIVIYKGKEYNLEYIKDKNILPKRFQIIILNEDIYFKKAHYKDKAVNENFIEKIINKEFNENSDYLYDYYINKRDKSIQIQAIKGGKVITEILKNKSINIAPFQKYVFENSKNISKKEENNILLKFIDCYYFIRTNKKDINTGCAEKDFFKIINKIKKLNLNEIYIQKDILDIFKENYNIKSIKILEKEYNYEIL